MIPQALRALALGLPLVLAAPGLARAHGDAAPQPIDTTGLPPLGDDVRTANPYAGNALAVQIGAGGYNQNCARCHGLDAKSGGMAPDLREVESGEAGDGWFITRVLHGAKKDDRYRMPPFEGILSQEAIWAIRTYVEAQPKN
ncbi:MULTISPECIES: cytochrome c-550 PedF [Methylobacterium]|uniref:cytochrome c-550 PedF n=1 Tax=Methylobacterium TaxID=407 RepID=UPI001043379E|nr:MULTISPECIES: cytochrome c-550 PedF [Methylobacterium]MDR7038526.1 cytochrome c-550 PedF [Methylobacterium sp. BE186]